MMIAVIAVVLAVLLGAFISITRDTKSGIYLFIYFLVRTRIFETNVTFLGYIFEAGGTKNDQSNAKHNKVIVIFQYYVSLAEKSEDMNDNATLKDFCVCVFYPLAL